MNKNDFSALFQYINKAASRVSKEVSGDKPIVTGTILASTPGRYRVQIANSNENDPVDAIAINSNDTFKKNDYVYLLKSEVASGDLFEFKYFIFGLVDETHEEFYNLTDWERFSSGDRFTLTDGTDKIQDEVFLDQLKTGRVFEVGGLFSCLNGTSDYGLKVSLVFEDESEQLVGNLNTAYFIGQPFNLSGPTEQKRLIFIDSSIDLTNLSSVKLEFFKNNSADQATVVGAYVSAGSLIEVEGNLSAEISVQNGKNYFTKDGTSDEITLAAAAKYNNQILSSDDIQYYWFIKFNESDLEKIIENWKLDQKNDTGVDPTEGEINIYKDALEHEYNIRANIDFLNIHTGDGWVCLNSYSEVQALNGEVVIWNKKSNSITFNKQNDEVMKYFIKFSNSLKCIIKYLNNQIESEEIEILNFEKEDLSYQINFTGSIQSLLNEESILTVECKEVSPNPNAKIGQGYYVYEWYISADKDADISSWTKIPFEDGSSPSGAVFDRIEIKDSSQETTVDRFDWDGVYRRVELNSNEEYLICKVTIYADSSMGEDKHSEYSNVLELKSYVWSSLNEARRAYKYYISYNRGVLFNEIGTLPKDWKIDDSFNTGANWSSDKESLQDLKEIELEPRAAVGDKVTAAGQYLYYTYQDVWEQKDSDGTVLATLERSDWVKPTMLKGVTESGTAVSDKSIEMINTFNELTGGGVQEGAFLKDPYYEQYRLKEGDVGKTPSELGLVLYIYDEGSSKYVKVENALNEGTQYYTYQEAELYINASYINTGALTVTDKETKEVIFSANIAEGEVYAKNLSTISANLGTVTAGAIQSENYQSESEIAIWKPVAASVGLSYSLSSDGESYTVTGIGTCSDADVAIPNVYNNLPVTSIGERAFYNCSDLTNIVIPDSVTSIGDGAFFTCSNLISIVIPDSVTSIGSYALYYCSNLTSVMIPDSVVSIGTDAFSGCTGLTNIVIPDSVISIGNRAFENCRHLTSIIIGDSVTSIGGSTFRGCNGLTSVVIPDSVTSIGVYTFQNCTGLTSIAIPDSVTFIDIFAFQGCTDLTSIVIPESVTSIGAHAFGNTGLTSVYYQGSAEKWNEISIGDGNPFSTDVTIYYYSENQPTIGSNYWHYKSQGGFKISATDDNMIDSQYFKVSNSGDITAKSGAIANWVIEEKNLKTEDYQDGYNDFIINEISITSPTIFTSNDYFIFNRAYDENSNLYYKIKANPNSNIEDLTEIILPNVYNGYPVKEIADEGFLGCFTNLEKLVISEGYMMIGARAFQSCFIEKIIFPSSLCEIGIEAFSSVYLKYLEYTLFPDEIGKTPSQIGKELFIHNDTSGYKEKVADDNELSLDVQYYQKEDAFLEIFFPPNITSLGLSCFRHNETLKKIEFSKKSRIKSIPVYAFYSCEKLEEVIFPSSLNEICLMAFSNAAKLREIHIPNGVRVIEAGAFSVSGIENIVLPLTIDRVTSSIFDDCQSLEKVHLGAVTYLPQKSFISLAKLSTLIIPTTLKSINPYAYCQSDQEPTEPLNIYYLGSEQEWNQITPNPFNLSLVTEADNGEPDDNSDYDTDKCYLYNGYVYAHYYNPQDSNTSDWGWHKIYKKDSIKIFFYLPEENLLSSSKDVSIFNAQNWTGGDTKGVLFASENEYNYLINTEKLKLYQDGYIVAKDIQISNLYLKNSLHYSYFNETNPSDTKKQELLIEEGVFKYLNYFYHYDKNARAHYSRNVNFEFKADWQGLHILAGAPLFIDTDSSLFIKSPRIDIDQYLEAKSGWIAYVDQNDDGTFTKRSLCFAKGILIDAINGVDIDSVNNGYGWYDFGS